MPKYIVDEETLRQWASDVEEDAPNLGINDEEDGRDRTFDDGEDDSEEENPNSEFDVESDGLDEDNWIETFDVEAEIARRKREPNGQLSEYIPAQCALDEGKLHDISRLALSELRRVGATHLVVDYNGGHDEGFADFRTAQMPNEQKSLEQLVQSLEDGPLGEAPLPQPNARCHEARHLPERTRAAWTRLRLESLPHELAVQLLGRSYGTGEYSLEGAFVADLQANMLTDIAPRDTPSPEEINYVEQHRGIDAGQLSDAEEYEEQEANFSTQERDSLGEAERAQDYAPVQVSFEAVQLRPTARLALEQLQLLGVTQITARYETKGPKQFVFFKDARTLASTMTFEELITHLAAGPLGTKLDIPLYYRSPVLEILESQSSVTSRQWAQENFSFFIHELFWQLLKGSTAQSDREFALEGSFIADLRHNIITDLAPEEH